MKCVKPTDKTKQDSTQQGLSGDVQYISQRERKNALFSEQTCQADLPPEPGGLMMVFV